MLMVLRGGCGDKGGKRGGGGGVRRSRGKNVLL